MSDYVPPWRKNRKEVSVETKAVVRAKAAGWWELKIISANRDGYPDRLFFKDDRYVWIEFKRPKGELRELQDQRRTEMRDLGMEVYLADNEDHAMWLLETV
jgi:hypothetical protein